MKTNSWVRIIDILSNLIFLTWVCIQSWKYPWVLSVATFLIWKVYSNLSPLVKMLVNDFRGVGVRETCLEARNDYKINYLTPLIYDTPAVYICNHGVGCVDDVVALGALASEHRSILVNPGPSGLSSIPSDSRDFMCCINRKDQSGYEATKQILEEENLGKNKSLLVFAEDLKTKTRVEGFAPRLRSGILKLCWEMNIPIGITYIDWTRSSQFPSVLSGSANKILNVLEMGIVSRYPREEFSSYIALKTHLESILKTI